MCVCTPLSGIYQSCTKEEYLFSLHICANDMQLYAHSTLKDVHGMLQQLQNCITDVREWCTSRRLQLSDAKTELVWFGLRSNLTKLASSDCSLLVGGNNMIVNCG